MQLRRWGPDRFATHGDPTLYERRWMGKIAVWSPTQAKYRLWALLHVAEFNAKLVPELLDLVLRTPAHVRIDWLQIAQDLTPLAGADSPELVAIKARLAASKESTTP